MTEIMVPYLLNDEQMESLKKITTAGMSPADMFISIMMMNSKGILTGCLTHGRKSLKNQHENM